MGGAARVLALVLLASLRAAAPASTPPPPGRTLVCYWGREGALDVTFASLKTHVLDVLGADLCACLQAEPAAASSGAWNATGGGAWRQAAAYVELYEAPASELAASWQAEAAARNATSPALRARNFLRPTGLPALYNRHRLWTHLVQRHGLLQRYAWFLFVRPDLKWLAPVRDVRAEPGPPAVWLPYSGARAERARGGSDRAAFVPAAYVGEVLGAVEAVRPGGLHSAFLDSLAGWAGAGRSTTFEHFFAQWLAWRGVPVRRFHSTAFSSLAGPAAAGRGSNETGHAYRHADELAYAYSAAYAHYSAAAASAGAGAGEEPLFYVIGVAEAERVNATLASCALSAWSLAVHSRLLAHPRRTRHAARAAVVLLPPHFSWDLHWPVADGGRERNAARRDAHFPLPAEGAGYEPYGASLSTSCRTHFSPCGYEGCLPAFGARALARLRAAGHALGPEGVLGVMEQLWLALRLVEGRQRLAFFDSGPPGPVAYALASPPRPAGWDLPPRAYGDPRFAFASANAVPPHFRQGRDVSLPTPWTEDVSRFLFRNASGAPSYLLTFKGDFATSAARWGGRDVRARAAALLHRPAEGVVVVDSKSAEGAAFDYARLMFDTRFALILRGDQPYSYRFTQAVCANAVPVLVEGDGWTPPFHSLQPFSSYGVLVAEEELGTLLARLRAMPAGEEERLRTEAARFCHRRLITVHAQTDAMVEALLEMGRAE